MESCPEFEYIYLFAKEDVEAGRIVYSEGVAANQLMTPKYKINVAPPVLSYESHPSILRFTRLPFDFKKKSRAAKQELQQILFGDFFDYMKEHDYVLAGDVLGVKIGFSKEEGQEWQYVLMHFPVDKINK